MAVTDCTLDQHKAVWRAGAAATVVAASGGYPDAFEVGKEITGLDRVRSEAGCTVFHSGTKREGDTLVTDGGRVLSVSGVGETLPDALATAYAGLAHIHFDGMHFRRDIGGHALTALR
jgi:phosphoribosylamine--glycine ligase